MKIMIPFIAAVLLSGAALFADTVYLKNGRSIDGIVQKEDEKSVVVNMGFGTVTFHRAEIKEIERSSAEDSDRMLKKWEEKRIELEAKEKEFEEARHKRFKESYELSIAEERARKAREGSGSESVQITWDRGSRSIIVDVLLNEKAKASLVLDTGASLVILSRKIGEELGLDLSDTKKDIVELKLADGRKSSAKVVILDSVKIQDVEVKKVMAAVMLDQLPDPGLKDGLLGMSFLNRFNFNMDLKNMKLTLEKLGGEA